MSFLSVYFRDLFRPRLTSVKAIIYDKGKEIDISSYPDNYKSVLMKSINDLWVVKDGSTFWFETEIVQTCSCWKRVPITLYVTCYKENIQAKNFKSETDIPIRYRSKMFDKLHSIYPDKVGMKTWSPNMQVKFVISK